MSSSPFASRSVRTHYVRGAVGLLALAGALAGAAIGIVTSGTLGPTVGQPVALAYVPPAQSAPGTLLHADVRGKPQPMRVATLPFAPHRYFRG